MQALTTLTHPTIQFQTSLRALRMVEMFRGLSKCFFVSLARLEARSAGVSQSAELIPLQFQVAYYFQVVDPAKLVQAVQLNGAFYTVNDLALYMSPIIDQAVSQVINTVSIKDLYANLHKISEAVTAALRQTLGELGINLLLSRVIRIEPEDETMRRVIQLNGIGLDLQTALRARLAEIMALRSDPAATNMFLGIPFYPINVLPFGAQLLQTSAQQSAQAQSANTATQTRQKEGSP